jgi:alpha-galactosidase
VLTGADLVVISIAVSREATWRRDRAIAEADGITHYGENGGPNALLHAARNIHTLLTVLKDVEALAPDALVVNFTNPLPRLCRAITEATSLRIVGLCHQLRFGYLVAGVALSEELGLSIPESYAFTWTDEAIATEVAVSHAAMERLSIRAAGLHHVTWMLDIRDRQGGESLLERAIGNLLHKVPHRHPNFEPLTLTRELAAVTGYIPVSGDTHLCEHLPYTARQPGRGRYAVQACDHDWSERGRHARRAEVALLAAGHGDLAPLRTLPTERVEHLNAGIWHDSRSREEAVNVMNRSAPGGPKAISNPPDDAIVEVPRTLHRDGVRAEPIGALPEPSAEWCRPARCPRDAREAS